MLAVSNSTQADLIKRGFRAERIEVVENGVDAERYRPSEEIQRFDKPTFICLGRLKRYKRVDLILDAVARLRDQGLVTKLFVVGRGEQAIPLQRHARGLRLGSDAVEFLGWVSESQKLELLQRAWVHVVTSAKEGWGITNLEAGACETPTVASDSPGLRDSVVDQNTGFLVPHGDTGALTAKLRELVTTPRLRAEMGEAARTFALGFSWDRTADRLEEHLVNAVAARRSGN